MRRLWVLVALLGVLAISYGVGEIVSPGSLSKPLGRRTAGSGSRASGRQVEEVVVKVTIPALEEEKPEVSEAEAPSDRGAARPPDGRGPQAYRKGCPMSIVGEVLGLTFARAHGCIIGTIEPGGVAAQAGLKPGDSITACDGKAVSCPSSLVADVARSQEGREVELTVRRPKKN